MRYLKWIMARLAGPRAQHAVILVALGLALPCLFSPLVIDEYIQAAQWRAALDHVDHRSIGSFLNEAFVFASGTQANYREEMEHGMGAWWPAPDFKTAFWRPLAAATHAVDLALWPTSAALMHGHTLLWFLVLLYALHALYRRFLTPRVAVLALALYAWDDARGQVLSWIAKRNALIAGAFGVFTLLAYDRWRRDGWRFGAWLAPVLFAMSLLSAEMGLGTAGFLFAYALYLDKDRLTRRLARLVPYLLIVTVWQLIYGTLGFGVEASVAYIHPLHEPVRYATRLIGQIPALFLGQLTPVMSDLWGIYPPGVKVAVFSLAMALLFVVARIARPRIGDDPQTRFWLLGAALCVLPISAASPMDCNLVFVGFGLCPPLAMLLTSFVDNPPASRWPRSVVGALAVCNLAIAPVLLPPKCLTMLAMGYGLPRFDESIPRDPGIADHTLVVVWAISEGGLYASSNHRYAQGIPKPGRTRLLSTSFADVTVTRPDEVTLRLHLENGFFDNQIHRLMRGPSRPFRLGETVQLSNMTAIVTELTDDDRPKTVEFRFAAPLEAPEWVWMRGQGFRLVGWTPPKVGETVVVPAAL